MLYRCSHVSPGKESVSFSLMFSHRLRQVRARWYEQNGLTDQGQEGNVLSIVVGAVANQY